MRKQAQNMMEQPLSDPQAVQQPGQGPVATDPLQAGLQFGMAGAMTGLGLAAILQGLRRGIDPITPQQVVKPAIIGALLGGALGYGGARFTNRGRPAAPAPVKPQTWGELAGTLHENLYPGTEMPKQAMDKTALLAAAVKLAPVVGRTLWSGLRYLPELWKTMGAGGVGRAVMPKLWNALNVGAAIQSVPLGYRNAKGMVEAGQEGDYRTMLRHSAGLAGNAIFALGGIGAVGQSMKSIARLGLASKAPMTAAAVNPFYSHIVPTETNWINSPIKKLKELHSGTAMPTHDIWETDRMNQLMGNHLSANPEVQNAFQNISQAGLQRLHGAGARAERFGGKFFRTPALLGANVGLALSPNEEGPRANPGMMRNMVSEDDMPQYRQQGSSIYAPLRNMWGAA